LESELGTQPRGGVGAGADSSFEWFSAESEPTITIHRSSWGGAGAGKGRSCPALLEVTYLLSNGQIITCSPTEHSDLFYGALGSCGTFGLLISATLRLLDVPPDCFVRCQYVRRNEPIESFSSVENDEDYLDGIVFSDSSVIIRGKRVKKSSIGVKEKIRRLSRAWDPCFYQHVKGVHQKSNPSSVCEYIPLKDYLFRYDRGACWMGRYPINPFHDQVQYLPIRMRKWFDLLPFGGYNLVSRTLLSPLFTTAALYKRLHASSNAVINDMLLIQDVYIPLSTSKQFVTFLQSGQLFGIENEKAEPIWLCPIRSCSTSQKLSPHCVEKNTDDQQSMMIDFGVWTHRHSWKL
jgi:Delta24-sterol reductase